MLTILSQCLLGPVAAGSPATQLQFWPWKGRGERQKEEKEEEEGKNLNPASTSNQSYMPAFVKITQDYAAELKSP